MMLSRLPTALSLLLITTWAEAAPGFIARNPAWSIPENAAPGEGFVPSNAKPLPAQICGIIGGYVLTVLIWGVLLLVVGRRMRRKTENSPKTLELELVTNRPPPSKTPLSPASAKSTTSWSKKLFRKGSSIHEPVISNPTSPAVHSPNSFDQKIVEADRERAQLEMERLYAAVMDHDRKKSVQVSEQEATELQERRPASNSGLSDRRPSATSDRRPSAINTAMSREPQSNPASPIKAIYPPGYQNGPPTAPLPRDRLREQPPASPRSILSKKSNTSMASSSSKAARFNLKNLRISGPIQKYPGTSANDEARTPLSPRFYNPGAPPSPPTQQNSPTTPGDMEAYEQLDEVQPLPRTAPSRFASSPAANSPTARSATSSSGSLPLRGFAEPLKSPDIQTTYVDRRLDKLSLTTPKTSVPFTPYSPYMPFTPITPITPHLVTKKDRKMSKKIQGRKIKTHEEDMVQSPKEIFGDAW